VVGRVEVELDDLSVRQHDVFFACRSPGKYKMFSAVRCFPSNINLHHLGWLVGYPA
jgi:hypothetical protein